jgi:hypothetical protein
MKIRIFFLLLLSLWLMSANASAQEARLTDSVTVLRKQSGHSPNRAANMSAIIPGLGQAYNKKYWKMPIIYGGAAALIYSYSWNNRQYQKYLGAYKLDSDTSSATNSEFQGIYTVNNLITLKDYYRRNRDLSVIGMVVLYAANVVDAYVDGHFYDFDISDDLSMKVNPYIVPDRNVYGYQSGTITGVSLTLNFKR